VALQATNAELKAQNEKLTLDLIRKDVELKSLMTDFESRKTGLEKNSMELAREREQELLSMRQVLTIYFCIIIVCFVSLF
jgi:hypothetical protein